MKYVLLTGATGFIGRFLLKDLLQAGQNVAVLVRSKSGEDSQSRIESVLRLFEGFDQDPLPRPICIEGDITKPGLALSQESIDWITNHCDQIIHNAASVVFQDIPNRSDDIKKTNIEGTQNVLEVCQKCNILDFHYVSTAYVCGLNNGEVSYENALDKGQEFRNEYERSKFKAESLLRETNFLNSLTVYRPAVVAGSSDTGYTSTYHGLYLYLKLMSIIIHHNRPDKKGHHKFQVRLKLNGDAKRNIIPVDWVSDTIMKIFNNKDAHGKTYHLTTKHTITHREIIDFTSEYFNYSGVRFCGNDADIPDMNVLEQAIHDNIDAYRSYDIADPIFDTSNLESSIPDIEYPKITKDVMFKYISFGEKDKWGRKASGASEVNFWIKKYLEMLSKKDFVRFLSASTSNANVKDAFGLDVWGKGGGQWSFFFNGGKTLEAKEGIDKSVQYLFRLTSDEFQEFNDLDLEQSLKMLKLYIDPVKEPPSNEDLESICKLLFQKA